MNMNYIPVVFCFDRKYSQAAAVATYSLISNSQSPLRIYWIVPSNDYAGLSKFKTQIEEKIGHEILLRSANISIFQGWKTANHFNESVYLRLLIPELVDEKKVIYLDSDTIVLGDLLDLFTLDINSYFLGGAVDDGAGAASQIPLTNKDQYINSGVLLMNLDSLRENNFLSSLKKIQGQFFNEITWPDQCLLNKFADEKKLILDSKWNLMLSPNAIAASEFKKFITSEIKIIHFVGSIKPWQKWCNPEILNYWKRYAELALSADLILEEISNPEQAFSLALSLDLNGAFNDASMLKSEIITYLFRYIGQLK